ncbi:rhodanese-like domain-containing protein [Salinicoccus albus]|uniref:rhodanese-like domain-containing protein n=1 Tax=Salinicoccus albus TaxID=418756 RepID=UPI0003678BE7|nr:rhodanese-like domain-containing protein [Salinicoccus albus]
MAETIDAGSVNDVLRADGNVLIDVRETPELQETGFIPGALHYPMSSFESTIPSLDKDKTYYVICRSGRRSEKVQHHLLEDGFDAVNVLGGMEAYEGPVNHL